MAARAFLLFLVGCTLFSDKSAYAVSVAYLECFRDLNSCGGYAWGAAALAYLYDNLREASMHQTRTVSGHGSMSIFLHYVEIVVDFLWGAAALAYLYDNLREASMHQTRTVSGYCCRLSASYVEDYPRALKWMPKRDKGFVLPFRKALDEIDVDEVSWTPYEDHRLKRPFEDVSLFRGWIRWGPKMYAHLPDIVLWQYGHVQTILGSPLEVVGQTTTPDEMDIMFTQYVVHVVDASAVVQGHVVCSNDYMDWFHRISHPYIIPDGGDPADDTVDITRRTIQIAEELIGRQLILPDGVPLINELILMLRSQRGGGRDWTNTVPYRRRNRRT
uniref:Protein MAIN-LIKE 1-like n=1 Tax=Cicer arietinum TaxID=3827 RepID=A0A1S2YL71_CICAR|nr:protein MAIN-LIKE 1-like [Cicer arietinum]